MQVKLLFCGYSYHVQPFLNSYIDGLPYYLFRLQSEGTAAVRVNGERLKLETGDLLLCRPGDKYELQIEADENGGSTASGDYYLFCEGDWIDSWWAGYPKTTWTRIDPHDDLLALWRLLVMESRRLTERNAELSGYLLQALCLHLDRAVTETPSGISGHAFVVSRMKRFIEANATHPFKVEEVSAHVRLSASRAAHLFKELQGESIMAYALKVRLGMAADRMKFTQLTIGQIAESCGLGSYPYFHRVFKEHYGCSPREYRSMLANDG